MTLGGFSARLLWREFRSGELLVLVSALTLAVGSVTAVGFLTDRVAQAVAAQAAEVLAADLRLRSGEPLDEAILADARSRGLSTAETLNFPSVVYLDDDSALASLKAVSDGYPLRGRVRVARELLGPEEPAVGVPAPGSVWPDTALMARLGANVGDTLEIGESSFRIDRVLTYRPDQSAGFTGLAPGLLINIADIDATGLIGGGSRVRYAQLFAGPRAAVQRFAEALESSLDPSVRVETQGDAGERLQRAIERSGRFLALASLVSLLLAAVAVAMSARRYAERRLDTAALMKSLGATQGFVLATTLVQLLCIAIVASLLGAALGFVAERALTTLLAGLIRADLPPASLRPVALGFGTATLLLAGFALPSLLRLRSTPPLRVLRHDLAPPPLGAWVSYGLALAALGLMIYWAIRDLPLVAIVMTGTAATAVVLYAAGRLLVVLLTGMRRSVGVAWRYGLANVARRGTLSAVQVVAFGLGLMVLLFLTIVRNDLMAGWRDTVADDAPNQFLINIQPDELDSVRRILANGGLDAPTLLPLVRGRMTAINGEDVRELEFPGDRGDGFVRREANLTYSATLSPSNTITAGAWWPADYDGEPLVSVDEEVLADVGLSLGDRLTFTIAGSTVDARIASARAIEWDSFEPNFFMVLSPGAIEDYPQTFVGSLHVPDASRPALLSLVRAHPSISVIDLGAILEQVRSVIDRASTAVQSVFVFTLGAGLVVLFAAVQATLDERRFESALLRTFGATSSTVFAGVAAEFLALGVAAGLFAALGASLLGQIVARELFDLSYGYDALLWFGGVVAGAAVVGVSGLIAARSAVSSPPVQTLRNA